MIDAMAGIYLAAIHNRQVMHTLAGPCRTNGRADSLRYRPQGQYE